MQLAVFGPGYILGEAEVLDNTDTREHSVQASESIEVVTAADGCMNCMKAVTAVCCLNTLCVGEFCLKGCLFLHTRCSKLASLMFLTTTQAIAALC